MMAPISRLPADLFDKSGARCKQAALAIEQQLRL